MDLVRALPDLGDLGAAHQPLDAVVIAIAVVTMQLHGFGSNPHREI